LRWDGQQAFNDALPGTSEAADRDEVDVRLVDPVPCVECTRGIVLQETTGRQQLPRIRVHRICSERGRRQLDHLRPPPLQQAHSSKLSQRCRPSA
jgi:hypothetical protein